MIMLLLMMMMRIMGYDDRDERYHNDVNDSKQIY